MPIHEKVLLLDGGGTQTLPIAKSLFKDGYEVHIFFTHKFSYGPATRYKTKRIQSPSINDETDYTIFFEAYVKDNSIDVVIPMSDPSAQFLSKNKHQFLSFCRFIAPDYDTFLTGYDKNKLMKVCQENDFPMPKTIDLMLTDVSGIDESFFPAIIKPNLTTGGRGMKILNSKNEMENVFESNVKKFGPCHLQEFIKPGGRQFKVELFLDESHKLINSSVIDKIRYYPVSGGSSCFNVSVRDDKIVEICYQVLVKIGWIGFADFDLIEDPRDGVFKIMEINPRIPACIRSVIESGIDYGKLIVDSSMGRRVETYEYIPGKQLRHLGFDFLWLLSSKDRFHTHPGWFRFFKGKHYFQDLSLKDPLPFFYGSWGNMKKIFDASFRESKSKKA